MSAWLGLAMFVLAIVLMASTGLPVFAVLIGVASAFAALGVAIGAFEPNILVALPSRWVGLLEHDLLQALPLYALIGALLNRLPLAALLQRAGQHVFARSGAAAAPLSGLAVGALLAPMNGSVGASLHMLSRSLGPALAAQGLPAARCAATLCTASTLGLLIPPSLVLLLLGDAMMRAHTEAVSLSHAAVRIVNTQDVMRAALLPGALALLGALAIALWQGRSQPARAVPGLSRREAVGALVVVLAIGGLLAAVAAGRFFAVEAAASGALAFVAVAALRGELDRTLLRQVLDDTLALSGMLFALLLGATTFSLVLRAYGTDTLVAGWLHALAPHPTLLLGAVLAALLACSFVLDAFEMIFLVVPIVMPPVLASVDDAAWLAAVTLLVLQAGFLLPPFGYAVVMSRSLLDAAPPLRALARALLPQLVWQALLVSALLAWPQITRWTRPAEPAAAAATGSDADALMQQAIEAQQRGRAEPASEPRP